MREEIKALLKVMKEKSIDLWLVPSEDAHGSEYVGEHDLVMPYLSGFMGNSGNLLISDEYELLWTDGRYFVQAEGELAGSGIELMRMGVDGVLELNEYLELHLGEGQVLGFDGRLVSTVAGKQLAEIAEKNHASLKTDIDIIDEVWKTRPAIACEKIWDYDDKYAGESPREKISKIRDAYHKEECTAYIMSDIDDIAWLTNLRGSDIQYNTGFLSYAYIDDTSATVYLNEDSLTEDARQKLQANDINTKPYTAWFEDLTHISGQKILFDEAVMNYSSYLALESRNEMIVGQYIAAQIKCKKNKVQQQGMIEAHIRDGVYMCKFLCWLEQELRAGHEVTEISAMDHLDALRLSDEKCVSLSFGSISAAGPNAAMCHYEPSRQRDVPLDIDNFYLIDSGGHYLDGTTDVTRTVSIGNVTDEMKRHYTLVAIGMLRLQYAVFRKKRTRGTNLDTLARSHMWQYGLDFEHGTGHGVGCCSAVHEAPVSIRTDCKSATTMNIVFEEGMVSSDEPGLYFADIYGIRLENLIMCVEDEHPDFLRFKTLTLVPLKVGLLDTSIMNGDDIRNFNRYQKEVYDTISPHLDEKERQ